MSEIRQTYGAAERRIAPRGRRADDEGTGLVDTRLFGRVALAHREAEEAYFRALDAVGLARTSGLVVGIGEEERLERRVAAANGKAEGLAEALAILSGIDVVDVRARAAADSDARKRAGLEGVELARRSLEASRID